MQTAVLLFISKLYEFSVKKVWNYVLHRNGVNFYYNKGTAKKNWNLILHIGLMSIKAVSWINSTFERLTFSWKCPMVIRMFTPPEGGYFTNTISDVLCILDTLL